MYVFHRMWKTCGKTMLLTQTLNAWDQIKELLATRIGNEAWQNWLAKTAFQRADGEVLRVAVPNEVTRQWMEEEYSQEVMSAIRHLKLPFDRVVFEVGFSQPSSGEYSVPGSDGRDSMFAPSTNLNPKFTFDTFVVGSCNQFAHAAAKAVATVPAKTYNPLFIYGGVGMGKTHLMHAIGRSLLNHYAGMKIVFTTSERFINDMISCIKLHRMQHFHRHYRSADVLMVDDIQILGGKERTQEEFFHTFNELFEHQKQIIISSDTPPKSTPGLVERLRSRFEWGLMVDVQPPDLETKMAIL